MDLRTLLITAFVANVALVAVSYVMLPEQVAIHFGPAGRPDGWASKEINALLSLGIDTMMFAIFYFAPRAALSLPVRYLSLPNKAYWAAPANRERLRVKLVAGLGEFGTVLFGFLFAVGMLVLWANLAEPVRLEQGMFMAVFVLFMVYTLVWCVRFIVGFRRPAPGR